MGRNKKDPATTYRGKRQLAAEAKAIAKQNKLEEKIVRKELYQKGLCKGKDGTIGTFSEIGRQGGTLAWNQASREEQERRKSVGAAAWENADEEDRQRVRDEGAAAWYEASEEKKERFSSVYKSSFEV